jgi:predicted unusual protein kinase regulating ubiquinone biosynthesis (AarF/ABC1/UbiB family)
MDFIKNIYTLIKCINIIGFYWVKNIIVYDEAKTRSNIKKCLKKIGYENRIFIKLFQALSYNKKNTNKILGEELAEYTDNVPYTQAEFEHCLSHIPSHVILTNNSKPVASGLISLIFEGYMRNEFGIDDEEIKPYANNETLIFKVKRPLIFENLTQDLKQIKYLINSVSYLPLFKFLHLKDMYSENISSILDQTDFLQEIEYIKKFTLNNQNIDYIKIPELVLSYCSSVCIVMKKLIGKKNNVLSIEEKTEYLPNLSKFIIKSLLFDGLYHGDLHAGNILFLENNKIGILDFGIIGELTREEQNDYFNFFNHLKDENINELINHLLEKLVEPNNPSVNNNITSREIINLKNTLNLNLRIIVESKRNLNADDIILINGILLPYNLKLKKSFAKIELSMGVSESLISSMTIDNNYLQFIINSIETLFPII